jgi:hypothetical protein
MVSLPTGRMTAPWPKSEDDIEAARKRDTFGLEEICAREWASNPLIRDEFRELARYVAYRRAEARGLVRILGRGRGT